MKKIISVLLSLLVILCGIPFMVHAETANVIEVQVVWDDMCFVYSPKWDYRSCSYVDNENGWKAVSDANKIFVTNLSASTVTVGFDCVDMADGIVFKFYDSKMSPLALPQVTLASQANTVVRLLPCGVLSPDSAPNTPLGRVAIHIAVVS